MTPLPERQEHIETLPVGEVFRMLRTAPRGLDAGESAARLERFGPNSIAVVRKASLTLKLLANFDHLNAMCSGPPASWPWRRASATCRVHLDGQRHQRALHFWQESGPRGPPGHAAHAAEKATVLRAGRAWKSRRAARPGDVPRPGRVRTHLPQTHGWWTSPSCAWPVHPDGRVRTCARPRPLPCRGTDADRDTQPGHRLHERGLGNRRGVVLARDETEFGRIAAWTQSHGGELARCRKRCGGSPGP
jgi:hypothetical protein